MIGRNKDAFSNAKLGGLNDHKVCKIVCVNFGANLQILSDVLNYDDVRAFSLSGDVKTHQGVSYFDFRIRVCIRVFLYNVNLFWVPLYERHTVLNILNMVCKHLAHLYVSFRPMLVSASTDGRNTITGCIG